MVSSGPEFEMSRLRNAQLVTDAEGKAVAESCRQHPIDIAGVQAATFDCRLRCAHCHWVQAFSLGGWRESPRIVDGRAIVHRRGANRPPAWRGRPLALEQDGGGAVAVHHQITPGAKEGVEPLIGRHQQHFAAETDQRFDHGQCVEHASCT